MNDRNCLPLCLAGVGLGKRSERLHVEQRREQRGVEHPGRPQEGSEGEEAANAASFVDRPEADAAEVGGMSGKPTMEADGAYT